MIRIRCERADGQIKSLLLEGHAKSDIHGKDIVCSAVSAVVFGGLNALENPKSFNIKTDEESGMVEVIAKSNVSSNDYQVLNVIFIQLKSIEETNSKYVQIVEKGC